jgi:hypothetical protein
MSLIKLPKHVRAAMEAGADLMEYDDGWYFIWHGVKDATAYKTDSACAKAFLDFMEINRAERRKLNLASIRARNDL